VKTLLSILVSACVASALLSSLGCSNQPSPETKKKDGDMGVAGNKEAAKLAKDILGTWAKDDVAYTFREPDEFRYKGGDLTIKGKWKAVDGKNIEMTFTLSKAEVDLMKPIFEVAKKGVDALNDAAKKTSEASGGLIKFEPIPYAPEPKEGENTWKEPVSVKDDTTAEIGRAKYTKRLGTSGPFEQTGKFLAEVAGSGEVFFPIPYAEPPDVELKKFAGTIHVKIVDLKPTGFKWKHNSSDKTFGSFEELTFIAKGIPTAPDQKPVEQSGTFKATLGAKGEEKFAKPYASPPHVELSVDIGLHEVMITEATAEGFKWNNIGTNKVFPDKNMKYTARGVQAK
jgi:hypothetical protein